MPGVLAAALGEEDHVAGKVFVFAAESIGKPGTEGGVAELHGAGVDEGHAGVVVDGLGLHGADEADFVGDFLGVREEVGEPDAGFTTFFSFGDGSDDREGLLERGHAGDALTIADMIGEFLAVVFKKEGFGVEEVDLGRSAGLEEVDDSFGFGGVEGGFEETGG